MMLTTSALPHAAFKAGRHVPGREAAHRPRTQLRGQRDALKAISAAAGNRPLESAHAFNVQVTSCEAVPAEGQGSALSPRP